MLPAASFVACTAFLAYRKREKARGLKVGDWMWLIGGSCIAFWDHGTAILARTKAKGGRGT
jgi:hypothetical protein